MNFAVHELPKTKADKRFIFEWLFERSPRGAGAWLDAYDDILRRLETNAASCGEALENKDCELDVKQAFFKTKRGRVYRVLFFIEDVDVYVYVLRVRGPGRLRLTCRTCRKLLLHIGSGGRLRMWWSDATSHASPNTVTSGYRVRSTRCNATPASLTRDSNATASSSSAISFTACCSRDFPNSISPRNSDFSTLSRRARRSAEPASP
jgi:hypothetical protein